MWSQYDENLSDNSFLKDIINNHSDIIKRASEESWVICVPRIGTFECNEITVDTVLDHILVPNFEIKDSNYCTLNKKPVKVSNKQIQLLEIDGSPVKNNTVQILFEETFYIEKTLKYIVWCLEGPLFLDYVFCDSHQAPNCLETFHDCLDFLWMKNLGNEILELIRKECENFIDENEEFETENLQTQKELVGNLYSHCLQITLKNAQLNNNKIVGNSNKEFVENLKLAVETYMQNCLKKKLIKGINSLVCHNDGYFNKIVRNSNDLHLNDLNISNQFCDIITNAKCELNKLNNYVTVIDKINCLKSTFNQLCNNKSELDKNYCLNSDDILQIFVFLIIRLNINNWISNLIYLTQFRFSSLNISDQNNFLITTLEAAIEFIKSNQFLDLKRNLIKSPSQSQQETDDDDEQQSNIFDLIRSGNLITLKELLKKETKIIEETDLCHPLCNCDKCLKNKNNSSQNNIKATNEKGQTLLIFACLLGKREIVEYLINCNEFDVNCYDYFGRTPLHYACAKGYQDILLILLNNTKVDINLKDNDGNTCLHLASNNGHDNCIKALLYTLRNLEINNCNKYGETALHLAVRWNYIDIVKILLENQASTNIYNKRNQLSLHLANNCYMLKLLQQFTIESSLSKTNKFIIIEQKSINYNNTNCSKEHGIRPKTIEQYKKIDLLLKAIENNDMPLTCFHLGFKNVENSLLNIQSKCHPLCDCENCSDNDFEIVSSTAPSDDDLIEQHLNINTCNADGFTSLHLAAKYGRSEILRLLLDSQALPNIKTYKTLQTPLHLACIYQRIQIVRELVKCGGCQIDCYDYKGNTPLYYACIKNDTRLVEILLSNGADCNIRNHKGKKILSEVQDKMLYGVFKLLKDHSKVDLDTDDFLF